MGFYREILFLLNLYLAILFLHLHFFASPEYILSIDKEKFYNKLKQSQSRFLCYPSLIRQFSFSSQGLLCLSAIAFTFLFYYFRIEEALNSCSASTGDIISTTERMQQELEVITQRQEIVSCFLRDYQLSNEEVPVLFKQNYLNQMIFGC